MTETDQHAEIAMKNERSPITHYPLLMTVGSAILFFLLATLRHALFKSNAYDLGWYDQYIYLISQGLPPIVSFRGQQTFHLLGDHVAIICYPLALLYKIYATVHWLFAVQAIALAGSCWLVWLLSRQSGLKETDATMMAAVYLLYPLIFNVNIYDFHPEVLAIPGMLGAVWAARERKYIWFCSAIALILSCKAVLSLTVAAMGFWLFFFEKRRWCGAIALLSGSMWFIGTTQWIIPQFLGMEQTSISRYGYLGDSVLEIALNLFLKPDLVWGHIFSFATLEYLALLFLPVVWGLSARHFAPFIPALPALLLNILSQEYAQRNLVRHYSVPIFPFIILALIAARSANSAWIRDRRVILAWSLCGFLVLGKYYFFGKVYLDSLDTWQANREAIALIQRRGLVSKPSPSPTVSKPSPSPTISKPSPVSPSEAVLAPSQLIPHLSHRATIRIPSPETPLDTLQQFKYILLDRRHPGFASSPEIVDSAIEAVEKNVCFERIYQRDEVFLYLRR